MTAAVQPVHIDVLDHGYIRLVESWGSDERIIEAARMSTAKGFLGWGEVAACERCLGKGEHGPWGDSDHDDSELRTCNVCKGTGRAINKPGDEKLLRYLYENRHDTPFEMAGAIIEVQAPIFIFREWHRHRTQGYNELSARYTPLPDVAYTPSVERCFGTPDPTGRPNKQAQGHRTLPGELTHEEVGEWLAMLEASYRLAERAYQTGLALGIPKEVARCPVPVARYSRMRATANLRNWLGFLSLRSDKNPGAQWEIRQYGSALHDILTPLFPRTLALFDEPRERGQR
jgi:thymidylate synthase (FAD)